MATLSFYIYNYTKDEVCTYFGMEGSALSPSRGQKYEFPMNNVSSLTQHMAVCTAQRKPNVMRTEIVEIHPAV